MRQYGERGYEQQRLSDAEQQAKKYKIVFDFIKERARHQWYSWQATARERHHSRPEQIYENARRYGQQELNAITCGADPCYE